MGVSLFSRFVWALAPGSVRQAGFQHSTHRPAQAATAWRCLQDQLQHAYYLGYSDLLSAGWQSKRGGWAGTWRC